MMIDPYTVTQKINALEDVAFYSDSGVVKTPLEHSVYISELCQCNLYLKCENLQTTGSFKIRGATSAVLNLSEVDRDKGVITASSGNHGAATAAAAKALGIPVSIYVPSSISAVKEEKIMGFGASLIKIPGLGDNAEREAAKAAREQGLLYLSPYNHLDVIAGQGTIGVEILAELAAVDAVFASVGGGGLLGGIGSIMKLNKPEVEIIGCWPENAPAMLRCMEAGKVLKVAETETLSDGTAGGIDDDALTLPICQEVITGTVTVTENEIAEAMKLVHQHHGYIIEGAAGVALAGLIKNKDQFINKTVVIVLCGGNIADEIFEQAMQMATN